MNEFLDFSAVSSIGRSVRYERDDLDLYQRLIQYFTVVAEAGGEYLDLVNFHRELYPQVITCAEIDDVFAPEHGYGSPDSSSELAELICTYERARASAYARGNGRSLDHRHFDGLTAGCGSGTTGTMNCLIPAVRDFQRDHGWDKRSAVVVTLPQYSVYDGIVKRHGLEPLYLRTRRSDDFLPTLEDISALLQHRPAAVLLTFPGNPAQTTYINRHDELARIVRACQATGTFLLVDNVYQDTLWAHGLITPEVLALGDGVDYVCKIFGPSKDRPGMSGMRLGYYCGDSRIRERFFYYSSIQCNTQHSGSRCLFALDILFRFLRLTGHPLTRESLDLLGDHVAGWGRPLDRLRLFDTLSERQVHSCYLARLGEIEERQRHANTLIRIAARELGVFSEVVNQGIGNVVLLRVDPEVFAGTDHELFLHVYRSTGIGILPANAFGFPLTRGEAWFRITTIHDDVARIIDQLSRVASSISQVGKRAGSKSRHARKLIKLA